MKDEVTAVSSPFIIHEVSADGRRPVKDEVTAD